MPFTCNLLGLDNMIIKFYILVCFDFISCYISDPVSYKALPFLHFYHSSCFLCL